MITSPHNPRIKLVRSLRERARTRRQTGAFVIEGVRLVEEAAQSDWPFHLVLFDSTLNQRGRTLVDRLRARGVPCEETTPELLRSLSDTETPQGFLAVVERREVPLPQSLTFVLVLDRVRDPGNVGTLLRSAEAAGAEAVFLSPETADPFSPKVLRAGMGAHFRLPIRFVGWEDIAHLVRTNQLQVLLADMEGEPFWAVDMRLPLMLIVGGEAQGASEQARRLAERRVTIPMVGRAESLNAAVAGSVLMFEVRRQRSSASIPRSTRSTDCSASSGAKSGAVQQSQ